MKKLKDLLPGQLFIQHSTCYDYYAISIKGTQRFVPKVDGYNAFNAYFNIYNPDVPY